MNEQEARDYIRTLAGQSAIDRLEHLLELLIAENARQNLVSAGSLGETWTRHFADSAQLLPHGGDKDRPWIDLGSGAGFPGLVIAALAPDREVVLVEQRPLRAAWLERAAAELHLPHCNVANHNVRNMPAMVAGTISARAFAPLRKLLAMARHLSDQSTVWLLPKGRTASAEHRELSDHLRAMFHVEPSLTAPDGGIIIGVGKGRP